MIETSAYLIAQRFIGTKEVRGVVDDPRIMSFLTLDNSWPQNDEVPWCSAFCNYIAWLLRLPRSKDLRARSWLKVGIPISAPDALADSDVVIIQRGSGIQPGPEIIDAPGHVGFYAGFEGNRILILGGNQSNAVNISSYPMDKLLGIRRLIG